MVSFFVLVNSSVLCVKQMGLVLRNLFVGVVGVAGESGLLGALLLESVVPSDPRRTSSTVFLISVS